MQELFFPAVIAAVETVGMIEIVKKFWQAPKGWVYTLIMIPLCVVFAFLFVALPMWVTVGVLAITLCQIGYEALLNFPKRILEKLLEVKK